MASTNVYQVNNTYKKGQLYKMKNLISIIIPVYNGERYLSKCIDSILNQTYSNLEVILVDDGSTDSSPKICDKYSKKDNRIKVIHKKNGGVSSARNMGISKSTGDYIGFVDSDDYIEPNMYENLFNALKDSHTEISMCGYNELENNKIIKSVIHHKNKISGEELLKDIFEELFRPVVWNKLFKRHLFFDAQGQICFPENVSFGEDALMITSILSPTDTISIVNEALYNYNIFNNSLSHNLTDDKKLSIIYYRDTLKEVCSKKFPKLSNQLEEACFNITVLLLIELHFSNLKNKKDYISSLKKDVKKYRPQKFKYKLKRFLLLYVPDAFYMYKNLTNE